MLKREIVLIVSNPTDKHTDRVVQSLQKLGVEFILFYPELLGGKNYFSGYVQSAISKVVTNIQIEANRFNTEEIKSVWYRRPRAVALDTYQLSYEAKEFAQTEWQAVIEGIYILANHSLWISYPDNIRRAERKILQLDLANQLGLITPETVITNNPDDARDFIEGMKGNVIVKAIGSGWVYTKNKDDVIYVLTNRLTESDINDLQDIEISPVIIQNEVSKLYEIRSTVVGQRVFSIKIDSQRSDRSQVDWRRFDLKQTPYTRYKLPHHVEEKCMLLVKLLGLEYGAIDIIRRVDGEYVFLEINPNGQFLWAEELSGVSISSAIAELLAGITPSLQSAQI
jgi:glutathione synthase/RimK-type ligase-like ATP-grasp enzyme